jgi:hypothetical protein
MNEWLTRQADALGVDPLTDEEQKTLLGGERTNAPLLCYLLGRAGRELDTLAEIVRSTS